MQSNLQSGISGALDSFRLHDCNSNTTHKHKCLNNVVLIIAHIFYKMRGDTDLAILLLKDVYLSVSHCIYMI